MVTPVIRSASRHSLRDRVRTVARLPTYSYRTAARSSRHEGCKSHNYPSERSAVAYTRLRLQSDLSLLETKSRIEFGGSGTTHVRFVPAISSSWRVRSDCRRCLRRISIASLRRSNQYSVRSLSSVWGYYCTVSECISISCTRISSDNCGRPLPTNRRRLAAVPSDSSRHRTAATNRDPTSV